MLQWVNRISMDGTDGNISTPDSKFLKIKSFISGKFIASKTNSPSPFASTRNEDCGDFHKKAAETIELTTKSQTKHGSLKVKKDISMLLHAQSLDLSMGMSTQITKWRAKRKGSYLFTLYEGLINRLESLEKQLKSMIDESLRDTASLTLQSKHLRKKLLLCIEHNQNIVLREAPVYNEIANVSNVNVLADILLILTQYMSTYSILESISLRSAHVPWFDRLYIFVCKIQRFEWFRGEALTFRGLTTYTCMHNTSLHYMRITSRVAYIASVLLEAVREHEQCLKYMLVFFDEVNVLKNLQGQAFIPWAFRVVSGNNGNTNNNRFINSSSSYSSSDDSPIKDSSNTAFSSPESRPPVELKRVSIQRRLKKITKMRQFLEKNVSAIETKYEKVSSNLSQCRKTLKALEGKLRRISSLSNAPNNSPVNLKVASTQDSTTATAVVADSDSNSQSFDDSHKICLNMNESGDNHLENNTTTNSSSSSGGGSSSSTAVNINTSASVSFEELLSDGVWLTDGSMTKSQDDEFLDTLNIKYDHSQCSDCSCVFTMANECLMNLSSAHFVAEETTKRLQLLISVKEKMRNDSQLLEACDWGGP